MPADGCAGRVLVEQGHGERLGIDAGPAGNPGAQRPQELRKRSRCGPIVRLTEERHSPASHDAAHLEVRKRDAGHRLEERFLVGARDEVLAILEARWDIEPEEAWRLRHASSVA